MGKRILTIVDYFLNYITSLKKTALLFCYLVMC